VREETALRKVLKALEENPHRYPPTSEGVASALRDLALEVVVDPKAFAEKTLHEAYKRTVEALDALWEALGLPPRPPEVEKVLREGGSLELRPSWTEGEAFLWLVDKAGGNASFTLTASGHQPSEGFYFKAQAGWLEVKTAPGLFARREGVFLHASPEGVETALEEVRGLRPLFASLGLSDLQGALEALAKLEDEEVRMEGDYLLVKRRDCAVLRRGLLLGEPHLDAALLLGEEVRLSSPQGIEVVLRGKVSERWISLDEVRVQLGEEMVRLDRVRASTGNLLDEDPVSPLIRRGLMWEVVMRGDEISPRMRALIEALIRHEAPSKGLVNLSPSP
jgi:hypothetical protein